MKLSFRPMLSLLIIGPCLAPSVFAQPRCVISVNLVNHNRYAYQTAEECDGFFHTAPWGNWGVNSNVGTRRDTDQFKGWLQPCEQTKVEWNSCSVQSRYRTVDYLNFPSWRERRDGRLSLGIYYPYPANGYPFSDSFSWNNAVAPYGRDTHVDQYSPCGPSTYGGIQLSLVVSALRDTDNDGIPDAGGCADLNGQLLRVQQNFMSVYELDTPDPDDLIESIYFPDLAVTLRCSPNGCVAIGDDDFNGFPDDVNNQFSPAYMWPTLYQDQHDVVCRPSDAGVPCKRIDATIRIGRIFGVYSGP
ncbi:MAG: hypothetical protein ABI882_04470 [Acidobacteriota bacterium]